MTISVSEARSLPAVIDILTAAELLGIGRTLAYELVRTGGFPTPVLRLGNQIKIPTAPLLNLLGVPREGPENDVERVGRAASGRGGRPPVRQPPLPPSTRG